MNFIRFFIVTVFFFFFYSGCQTIVSSCPGNKSMPVPQNNDPILNTDAVEPYTELPDIVSILNADKKSLLLYVAIKEDNMAEIEKLIADGMDLNQKPIFDSTYVKKMFEEFVVQNKADRGTLIKLEEDFARRDPRWEEFDLYFERPLIMAIKEKNIPLIQLLLENGADINLRKNDDPHTNGSWGDTPLMYAIETDEQAAMTLINAGADIEKNPSWGSSETALVRAIKKGNIRLVETLLSLGADIYIKGYRSVLTMAVEDADIDPAILTLLIAAGLDINYQGTKGKSDTVLMMAAGAGHSGTVRRLISLGADVSLKDDYNGFTALHYAIVGHRRFGHSHHEESEKSEETDKKVKDYYETVRILLASGADPNAKIAGNHMYFIGMTAWGIGGEITPLMMYGGFEELLIDYGADVNAQDENGLTALMVYSFFGGNITALIDRGAKVNMQDNKGRTALFYAIGNVETVELLLKKGASVKLKDKDGLTPLAAICFAWGYEKSNDIIQLLEKYGAIFDAADQQKIEALRASVGWEGYPGDLYVILRGDR